MSNLITSEKKRAIATMRLTRMSGMFLVLVTFVAMVGALALLPAYLSLRAQARSLAYDIEVLNHAVDVHTKGSEREQLAKARQEIVAMHESYARAGSATAVFYAAADTLTKGITITRLSYQAYPAKKTWTVTISGLVPGQRSAIDYASALRSTGVFADVSVPISALAAADDGRMTVVGNGNVK